MHPCHADFACMEMCENHARKACVHENAPFLFFVHSDRHSQQRPSQRPRVHSLYSLLRFRSSDSADVLHEIGTALQTVVMLNDRRAYITMVRTDCLGLKLDFGDSIIPGGFSQSR